MSGQAPTRSGLLALHDEHTAMQEGYQFLDEKRIVLATEIIALLGRYRALCEAWFACHEKERKVLHHAVVRHGLEALLCVAVEGSEGTRLAVSDGTLLGVHTQTASIGGLAELRIIPPVIGSPELAQVQARYVELVAMAAPLAAMSATLRRLKRAYQMAERRARALEDVLIPELNADISSMESQLEDLDREDVVRALFRKQ